ncbi:phosphatidic acid phosphatase [Piscirickettsia salmonis]|uniref:PAP2 superfamily protein n=2 Tax=Piscirickettsia salmonis TaxID=1238 RepID=A0A9Q5YH34_PISSA|nr:phosphatase PAP2 family protein [Piscirickettsia salmonis]ALA24504.1 PAP2 superfamily protein [Piscirickettsia salmonis]APS44858.1 phosphatidic acid phosphatase [Piscirickettsia salmonis]APS48219.1 phosphatidic acid phosphatase [Piscirickettsia salmonis]APS49486.1 phosphatidic acid phosphatase [Piscirickettsia salmonis]APS52664.1 phosphatidic acid phosphatase [Piscirickettsia salmonis]
MTTFVTKRRVIVWIAFIVIVYGMSYCWLDLPVALFFEAHGGDFYALAGSVSAVFSPEHWLMLAIVATLVVVVMPRRFQRVRGCVREIAFSIVFAIVIGLLLKYGLARYRPVEFFQHQLYGFHFFSMQHDLNSTPSGHSLAVFAGLTPLVCHWRWTVIPVLLIGVIVMLSRLVHLDHYLSDVWLGAWVGIGSACLIHQYYQSNKVNELR